MTESPLGSISSSIEGRFELTFHRRLPHAQVAVWDAVSTAEGLGRWLADAKIDLQPGGRIRLSGQCNVEGEVLQASAPSLLLWTWPHPDHPHSEVRITTSESGDATHLTLVQTDMPKRHLLDVAAGWHTHLDALSAAVLGQPTSFDPALAAMYYRRYAAIIGP